ncbi:MAG: hypothetical protein IPH16_11385 [Haliscomenobacter sp.]|nr:hypothetical protein [Haliscomenobacter sp.]
MSLLDPSFAPESRVWIYQSNRPFSEAEEQELAAELKEFTRQWVSHNQRLKAAGTILYHRFIALMVDENQVGAGGCSIDRSVAFLKQVQAKYQVDLFDRMRFAFMEGDSVVSLPREEFAAYFQSGKISGDTQVLDPLVRTKQDFEQGFVKPLRLSWHQRMV